MRYRIILCVGLGLFNASFATAAQCVLEHGSKVMRVEVAADESALLGRWSELDGFRVRTALAAPQQRKAWLLIEVYARAADEDMRIISSHTVEAPFHTGRVEIVEPILGRSLSYECNGDPP